MVSRFLVRARYIANIKLYSSYVPVDPLSPFLSNVELLCSRYCRMSFPFVGELISVLAFKVLRATTIVGVLTLARCCLNPNCDR